MARDRKRFNLKGRQGQRVSKDKVKDKKGQKGVEGGSVIQISVDSAAFDGKYDESNPLLLPQKEKKEKGQGQGQRGTGGGGNVQFAKKLLSKKQRKRLQQIVDRREKKSGRADLLEELQKYQLSPETFQTLTPLVQTQTEGLKKLFSQIQKDKDLEDEKERRRRKRTRMDGSDDDSMDEDVDIAVVPTIPEAPQLKKQLKLRGSIKGANKMKNDNQHKFRSWSGRFGVKAVDKKDDPKVLGFDQDSSSSDEEDIKDEGDDASQIKVEADMQDHLDVSQEQDDDDVEILPVAAEMVKRVCVELEVNGNAQNTDSKSITLLKKNKKRRIDKDQDQANGEMAVTLPISPRVPKTFVPVNRTKEIELVRSKLPIIPEEQVIMESITENSVTVLAGETGSGKTTQVPQFLYEAGYSLNGKLIGVTEPRRVAAISMSNRVAKELNLPTSVVSYQIRFDGNVSPKTQIKFMTDGVLLKEMERDFLLTKYSAICVDEAHERSLYTDLLIGLLSRCVRIRKKRNDPLKLIIMSATMRVEDFVENSLLFSSPPRLIHVPTRQFPVQTHFSKVTPQNYVVAAYKKVVQIHRKLPPGGILIFVTGQQEVRTLIKQLQKIFPSEGNDVGMKESQDSPQFISSTMKRKQQSKKKQQLRKSNNKPSSAASSKLRTFDLDKLGAMPLKNNEEDDDSDGHLDGSDEEDGDEWGDVDISGPKEPLHLLPLYSMLPNAEQQKVFDPPPEGSRLCVVATNVAETSLTIPSIRYVVDCGKVKLKVWDKLTGVQQFQICWESKASAEQRAGRAGRTGPGHCYRLFSSSVFTDEFSTYSKPEIQVRPVDDMMLLMKSMAIDRVQNFPYPSPPAAAQLIAAERTLLALGALETTSKTHGHVSKIPKLKSLSSITGLDDNTVISELGKTMAHFPLGPRFSKMLALSFHHSLVEYTIALVSALTVQEVFLDASLHDTGKDVKSKWAVLRRKWAGTGASFLLGDCMVLLRAVGAFEYSGGTPEFCLNTGLRFKAMSEIRKLRRQLTSEVNMMVSDEGQEVPLNPHMDPPTEDQALLLRQIILSGLPDRVGRKILESELKEGEDPKIYRHAYRCGELEDPVFLHASSILRSSQPQWIVYQELFESGGKMYLRGVSAIEPEWIPMFCPTMCKFGPPLQDPPLFYNEGKGDVYSSVKATYGKQGWELPIVELEYPVVIDKFKIFAQFLLKGKVYPKLLQWREKLLSMPVTMTKPWAKLQPRTQTLLTALTKNGIHSKMGLEQKWGSEKTFLLLEYLQWLPEELHDQVTLAWPPIKS